MGLNEHYAKVLTQRVQGRAEYPNTESYLQHLLRILAKWRSRLLANTVLQREGPVILNGPFAGMLYGQHATEGSLLARLLGSYESELHPAILEFAGAGFEAVIDIGCAEGFYAIGLARLMPEVTVHARDIDAKARAACTDLARRNGVSDRVIVGGAFEGADFAQFAGRKTLVFIDAEGVENELLDPEAFPALRSMTVIVETHEHERRGVTARLIERFSLSHDVERIDQGPKTTPLPKWFKDLGHLDQLLAVWEWRGFPTPWLVMRPR